MSTLIEQITELADVERCLQETGAESTCRHCHNACVWLMIQIKRAGLPDYRVCFCTGTFRGKDHSWLMVENEDGDHVVIDMTVDQFVDLPVPYIGELTDDYDIRDSALLCDAQALRPLVEGVGA